MRRHLEAIKVGDPEYSEAKKLIQEVVRLHKAIKKEIEIKGRQALAKELEHYYLSEGMDIRIYLSGPEKTVIKLEYVLFSRPLIYQIVNKSPLLSDLKVVGFKKVIFSDKYTRTWTFDLEKLEDERPQ